MATVEEPSTRTEDDTSAEPVTVHVGDTRLSLTAPELALFADDTASVDTTVADEAARPASPDPDTVQEVHHL